MKEDNGFAVANLLETKLGSKALLHDVQSRPLQPSEKIGRRRQYSVARIWSRCSVPSQMSSIYSSEKPIEIVEDEYRRGRRRRFRFRRHFASVS
jgi:hypothetical protein